MTGRNFTENGRQDKDTHSGNARPADDGAANAARSVPEQLGSFSLGQPITHTGFFANLRDQLRPKVRPLFDRVQKLCSWSWNPEGSSLGEPAKSTVDQLRKCRDNKGAERLEEKSEIGPRPATETALSVDSTKEGEKVDEEEQSRRRRALGYRTPREILRRIKRYEEEDNELERKEQRERERHSARQAGDPVAHAAKPVQELPGKSSSVVRSRRAFHRGCLGAQGIGKDNRRPVTSFRPQRPVSTSCTGYYVNLRDQQVQPQKRRSWSLHPDAPALSTPSQRILDQLIQFRADNLAERPTRKRPLTPMPLPPSVVKRIRLSGRFQENESKRRAGRSY